MIPMQEFLVAAAVFLALIAVVLSSLRKRREYRSRDAVRKLELVLQPRETVKVICPQKKGRVILTSRRILFDTKDGFNAIPTRTVKRVQGKNDKGNRTTSVANMASLTIYAEQEHEIQNSCPEFAEFAGQLMRKTAQKKK